MDDAVRNYIDDITPQRRPLFDRLHNVILETFPDATVTISYGIPTYTVDKHRLHLGVWTHGVSIYGWQVGHDGGFVARHPSLLSGKATIRLRPTEAAAILDDEFRRLVSAALADRAT